MRPRIEDHGFSAHLIRFVIDSVSRANLIRPTTGVLLPFEGITPPRLRTRGVLGKPHIAALGILRRITAEPFPPLQHVSVVCNQCPGSRTRFSVWWVDAKVFVRAASGFVHCVSILACRKRAWARKRLFIGLTTHGLKQDSALRHSCAFPPLLDESAH